MRKPVIFTYRVPEPEAPGADDRPVVPGYRLLEPLGSGAHGQVWRAEQDRTRRQVAIKLVARADATSARQELAALGRVRHPHVIRLWEWCRAADGRLALVTDVVNGPTLHDLVAARGALSPGEVVTLITPLAQALEHVHSRSLVHGDLSAGNVMFDAEGRPLLIDLGVSSLLGWQDAEHATGSFADPSTTAQGRHEAAGDIYSLAALAWFALTGQVPQGPGLRPPLLTLAPQVPLELAELLDSALVADPAVRPGPAEVAVLAYQACPAEPIRLVDPQAAPERALTQRLRRRADAEPAPDVPEPRPGARRRRWRRGRTGRGAAGGRRARGEARAGVSPGARRGRRRVWVLVTSCGFLLGGALAFWPGSDAVTSLRPGGQRPASAAAPDAPGAGREAAAEADGAGAEAGEADASPLHAALRGEDPVAAVRAASELRALAFGTATQEPLDLVDVAGSPAHAADLQTLTRLREARTRLDGLTFEISEATLLSVAGTAADVQVTVATSAHRVVGADGQVLGETPATAPVTLVLALERVDGTWRISSVSAP